MAGNTIEGNSPNLSGSRVLFVHKMWLCSLGLLYGVINQQMLMNAEGSYAKTKQDKDSLSRYQRKLKLNIFPGK